MKGGGDQEFAWQLPLGELSLPPFCTFATAARWIRRREECFLL